MVNTIIDYIARTNLFNFIIFSGIIIFLVCRLNVKSKMEAAVCDVENSIKESENAKIDSESQLSSIEESMNHLSEEVDNILKQSNENAILVGKRIESDTQHSIELIKESTQKTIENNLNTLKNDIIRRASLASVEVAKSHIIEELKRNPDLHDRLINESIEAIEGTEI